MPEEKTTSLIQLKVDAIKERPDQLHLDVGKADETARRQIAKSTEEVYRVAFAQFTAYCEAPAIQETALPARTEAVYGYLGHLAHRGEGLDAKTKAAKSATASWLGVVVSAIAWRHITDGHQDPTLHPAITAFLKGARRIDAGGRKVKKAHALVGRADGLFNELAAVVAAIEGEDLAALRDRALILLGWAAAFRRSELASLTLGDLQWRGDALWIPARRSKGDQEGLGATQGKGKAVMASETQTLCPIRSLRHWLSALETATGREMAAGANRNALPVFVGLRPGRAIRDAGGAVVGRHLNPRTKPITGQAINEIIISHSTAAGVDKVTSHGLRRGWLTTAAENGLDLFTMQGQSHHKDIKMLSEYVGVVDAFRRMEGKNLI